VKRPLALVFCALAGLPLPAQAAEYDCMIEARQNIEVRSSVEGIIDTVYVRRGDTVKRGQLLALLASGPERAALEVARSRATNQGELKSAAARVDLARKKWERAEELQKKNFVSENARDEALAEYRLAEEQLRVAQENQRLAVLDEKRAGEVVGQRSIRSPVNGVVVEVLLRPGELMSSNQKNPVMKLAEINPLNVELVLPVQLFGSIRPGQEAEVTPEQPVGGRHTAQVEVVDRVVDAASGTFGVRLRLPNPRNEIPAGVKCRARF